METIVYAGEVITVVDFLARIHEPRKPDERATA